MTFKKDMAKFLRNSYERAVIREAELATELDGRVRYFLMVSPGHSGSLWLSKVLNSHPDVMAFHEGMVLRSFPWRYYELNETDSLAWIHALKNTSATHYGKAYRAIGDTHIPIFSEKVREQCGDHFSIFGLTRNPVKYIHSQLASFDERAVEKMAHEVAHGIAVATQAMPRIRSFDVESLQMRLFIYCCWRWVYFASLTPGTHTYRLEDLTTNVTTLQNAIAAITNIDVTAKTDFGRPLQEMMQETLNTHLPRQSPTAEVIFNDFWDDEQRRIFDVICGDTFRTLYPESKLYD